MTQERIVRIVAGFFVMASLALGANGSPLFVSPYFLFSPSLGGLTFFRGGSPRLCPLNTILGKFGVKGGCC